MNRFGSGWGGIDPSISRATVELINTELGGVRGRPVELVECNWTDIPGAVACGQQFAADPTLSLVISPVDPAEFLDALGPDVPRFGGFIGGGGSGITFASSFRSQMVAITELIRRERPDADKVAYVGIMPSAALTTRPSGVELVDALSDPSSPTAIADSIRASGATDADVFVQIISATDCSPLSEAIAQLGIDPTVITDVCTNREDGWYYVDVPFNPDDPADEWGAAAAVDLLGGRGTSLVTPEDPLAYRGNEFADLMNAVKMLNELGESPGRDEIRQALVGFTGPAALTGPQDCSLQQIPGSTSFGCAKFVQVLRVEDGKFVSQEPVEITP